MCIGQFENIPLGRVYARDEDDWDIGDKTFSFAAENNRQFFKYVLPNHLLSALLVQPFGTAFRNVSERDSSLSLDLLSDVFCVRLLSVPAMP